jgi:hypothetical protein
MLCPINLKHSNMPVSQKYHILPERKHDSEYHEKGEILEGQVLEGTLALANMTMTLAL